MFLFKKAKTKKIKYIAILILAFSFCFYAFNEKDFQIAKNLDIFYTLFKELNLYYVDNIEPEKLIESGIKGMLESLDPYTTYIPESEIDDFTFMTTGQYGGIGALIRKADHYTIVSEPYEGFPAQKYGLKAGDTIIKIDNNSIKNLDIEKVSELLKGIPNTEVSVTIRRYGIKDTIYKSFPREKVTIKNVPYFGILDEKIGYIRIMNFTKDAGKEVKDALFSLKKNGIESIIIDLRSNPGGLLNEAVHIASLFVNQGQEIVRTKGKIKKSDQVYKTPFSPVDTSIPLVVLVNRSSASASEIVAGAFQDLDRAVIIGNRTFGKGLVQSTRPLSYNSQLKVTTAKYYIPSGRCIQALDYAHRNENGSVGNVPDSLISEFRTKNSRKVYDGGGIIPDINIDLDDPGNITIALYIENLIFDYATLFAAEHNSISNIEDFSLSDEMYKNFISFLDNKEFDYKTLSDEKLKELINTAKDEKYYIIAEDEFKALEKKLAHDRNKDLYTFQNEIKSLLEEEIVSRYYYQQGRIKISLRDDIQLKKAIEILHNKEYYDSVLSKVHLSKSI